jgi:hypothetical protein
MPRIVFADTSWFVALIDTRDQHAKVAASLARKLAAARTEFVITEAVLMEVCNYFARGPLRTVAVERMRSLRSAKGWEVVPIERPALLRAEDLYRQHDDKNWSLTDCHSMQIMKTRRIRQIATSDQGFAQAGYEILLG